MTAAALETTWDNWKIRLRYNPRPGDAVVPLVKMKQKGQVTLPVKIREKCGLQAGDYLDVQEEGDRIVLIPQQVVPRHPEIDRAIDAGLADIRSGRVTPAFDTMHAYKTWRKTREGKKFAKS